MLKNVAGLILYDGYVHSLNNAWVKWRRTPSIPDFESALVQNTGILHKQAVQLANSLKVLAIFNPYIYVYPYWLLNNPLLMVLSNLRNEDPNNISPVFKNDFLRVYWGTRERHPFSKLYFETYPTRGSAQLPRNSSWIDDIYYDPQSRTFFDTMIRRPLDSYVDSCLARLDVNFEPSRHVDTDPMFIMMDRAKQLLNHPETWDIPKVIQNQQIASILNDLIEYFDSKDSLFLMTEARRRWRDHAREHDYNWCIRLQDWVDWFLRENIYLPSHADAVHSVAFAYNKEAASTTSVARLQQYDTYDENGVFHVDNGTTEFVINQNNRNDNLANYLNNLSFQYIFENMRNQNYYLKYLEMIDTASREIDSGKQISKTLEAQCYLLGCICPDLYRQTGVEHFRDRKAWKLLGWDMDYGNGVIFSLVVPVTGAFVSLAFSTPVAVMLGTLTAVMATMRRVPQIDAKLKKLRGKRIMLPFARFDK